MNEHSNGSNFDARSSPAIIADDIVEPDLQQRLSSITERNIWRYGWRQDGKGFGQAYLCCEFAGTNLGNTGDCRPELESKPRLAPILGLWHRLAETVAKGHAPMRVYAVGNAFGSGGGIHRDNAEDPSLYSFVYYAHRRWEPDWGGETVFFDETGREVLQAVLPMPGRVTFFRGDVQHAARPPSRECPVLRTVYVFKTRMHQSVE